VNAVKVFVCGDSMVVRRNAIPDEPGTSSLRALIGEADVAFTNLEVVPTDFRGYPRGGLRGTYLNGPSGAVDDLISYGFNAFSCANNHSLNFGTEGLTVTLDVMRERSVGASGIGMNLAEARMPTYIDGAAGSCALLSCSSTFRSGEQAAPQRDDYVGRPGLNPLTVQTDYELTDEQFGALGEINRELGLERDRRRSVDRGMRLPTADDVLMFLDSRFSRGAASRTVMSADPGDVEGILRWVREAGRRADVVIVSVHCHEYGDADETPPQFLVDFAHSAIDTGAAMVVTHGPHHLRNMEIYRGRPVFYSLGNFIAQADYVERLPAEAYSRVGLPQSSTPADLFDNRSGGGRRGFHGHRRFWESVAGVCEFDGTTLTGLRLYPISLGFELPPPRRGRPVVAAGADGERILQEFASWCDGIGWATETSPDGVTSLIWSSS
jgi:Bacterial capsule synthesis protein PGA_cap